MQTVLWVCALHGFMKERLTNLGNYCLICGRLQEIPGLKPVPCGLPMCCHRHDELGFGADLHEVRILPRLQTGTGHNNQVSWSGNGCPSGVDSGSCITSEGHQSLVAHFHCIFWVSSLFNSLLVVTYKLWHAVCSLQSCLRAVTSPPMTRLGSMDKQA